MPGIGDHVRPESVITMLRNTQPQDAVDSCALSAVLFDGKFDFSDPPGDVTPRPDFPHLLDNGVMKAMAMLIEGMTEPVGGRGPLRR